MTIKERVWNQINQMDNAELELLEQDLAKRSVMTSRERKLRSLEKVAGMLADPEDYAAFEEGLRRRPFFAEGRTLEFE